MGKITKKDKDNEIKDKFSDTLSKLMHERNITRDSDIYNSDSVDIAQSRFSDIRNGKTPPTASELFMLADFFGVSVDDLIGHEVKKETSRRKTYADVLKAFLFLMDNMDFTLYEDTVQEIGVDYMNIQISSNSIDSGYDLFSFIKAYKSIMGIPEWSRQDVMKAYVDSQMELARFYELKDRDALPFG